MLLTTNKMVYAGEWEIKVTYAAKQPETKKEEEQAPLEDENNETPF